MNNPTQHRSWILGISRQVAGAALALAIILVPAVLATGSEQAQTYTESVLHTFTGPPDGAGPQEGVVEDAQGNLYGTTFYGGDSACNTPYGCGTVFKVDTTGKETVLYSFTGTGGDAAEPWVDLVLAKGNLYGTTRRGGDLSCINGVGNPGCGVVFRLSPEPSGGCPSGSNTGTGWCETVLHTFTESPDGAAPEKGLLLDAKGNLYGTTRDGGACGSCGAVFMLSPPAAPSVTWTETVLYSTPPGEPGGLLRDTQGNLYVPTSDGGAYGNGTVFMLAPPVAPSVTWTETTLYSFTGGADGSFIGESLLQDAQGNLYGIAREGGDTACTNGCGTVYKLSPEPSGGCPSGSNTGNGWCETVLYSFTGGTNGWEPSTDSLLRDAQGNLYGTTDYGGDLACNAPNGCGTVVKLAPPVPPSVPWTKTVLYTITNEADGVGTGSLVRDVKGNMYGAAYAGGDLSCTTIVPGGTAIGCGTVFKLSPATATTTTLTSSPNPSTYGQAVTFTATVTSKLGAPPDGETVSFMEGKTVLGTGTLSSGSASFTTSTLKVGTNSITAVYGGDSNLASSKSKAVKQVVGKATTTTALTSSLNPSSVGQSVTFTTSVTPEFSGTVTGTVAFYDGTTKLKTVTLSGGEAKYTTSKLVSGSHSITATCNGSTSFDGSSSAPLAQKVN
ncbi:MAG TPA: choice-of-anchor tandem repeat GloVer-containing protein [Terriglobales bacterium]|nr:choice-of-anchor tandem repeat GloVer-containing protein [Terriglobales bacterium]